MRVTSEFQGCLLKWRAPEITLRQPKRTPSLEQINELTGCAFLLLAPAFCDVALLACVHDGDLSMMLIPKAPDDISGSVWQGPNFTALFSTHYEALITADSGEAY